MRSLAEFKQLIIPSSRGLRVARDREIEAAKVRARTALRLGGAPAV